MSDFRMPKAIILMGRLMFLVREAQAHLSVCIFCGMGCEGFCASCVDRKSGR